MLESGLEGEAPRLRNLLTVALLLAVGAIAACSPDGKSTTDGGVDTSTGPDADTDTDTDSDGDGDGDAGMDASMDGGK